MSHDLLTYLAIGLLAHEKSGYDYPYPKTLQHGLNCLAGQLLERKKNLPAQITAVFNLFHQPINSWWPKDDLPSEIDGDFPLLYDGRVDEQVVEYLAELPVTVTTALPQLEAALDNQAMQRLLDNLRDQYHQRPERVQRVYEEVRRFLIRHPYTTNTELIRRLGSIREVDLTLMQQMYEPVNNSPLFMYQNQYWQCPHCKGLLRWRNGRPRCAKPSVCGRLYPDYGGRQPVKPEYDLMALKWSIHTRTCIPGLCEVALFDELNDEQYRCYFTVVLWPGVDRYDFQLRFTDGETWAADVKDYKNPYQLGRKIATDSLYDAEPALRWQRGYYVVPFYRTDHHATYEHYLAKVEEAAGKLAANITIINESGFLDAVKARVKQR
jgi:hypothetical protein